MKSIEKALRIFEFVAKNQPVGVTEIARNMDLTKSTAQRCLSALANVNWIRKEGERAKWVITEKALSMGQRVGGGASLKKAALPVMRELWEKTNETIHLVVPAGRETLLLEQIESPHLVRIFIPLNARRPLHTSANGKAILAYSSSRFLDRYLSTELETLTNSTISSPEELKREIARIRKTGWALSTDELVVGASAIASPIFDGSGSVIGSLSISCPTSRFPRSVRNEYGKLVQAASETITRNLRDSVFL